MQIAAFCKQQKLNKSSFYVWRKRLASNSICPTAVTDALPPTQINQDDWVNIVSEQALPSQHCDIELALPNGVVLRMMNSQCYCKIQTY